MAATSSTPTTKKGRQQQQPPVASIPKDRIDPFNLRPGLEVKGTKQYTLQVKISYETLRGWRLYRGPYLDDERALVDALKAKGVAVEIYEPEKEKIRERKFY